MAGLNDWTNRMSPDDLVLNEQYAEAKYGNMRRAKAELANKRYIAQQKAKASAEKEQRLREKYMYEQKIKLEQENYERKKYAEQENYNRNRAATALTRAEKKAQMAAYKKFDKERVALANKSAEKMHKIQQKKVEDKWRIQELLGSTNSKNELTGGEIDALTERINAAYKVPKLSEHEKSDTAERIAISKANRERMKHINKLKAERTKKYNEAMKLSRDPVIGKVFQSFNEKNWAKRDERGINTTIKNIRGK